MIDLKDVLSTRRRSSEDSDCASLDDEGLTKKIVKKSMTKLPIHESHIEKCYEEL